MLNALTNVCFEGKNGHDAGVTPFPLMTHSGHAQSMCAMPAKHPKRKTSSIYSSASAVPWSDEQDLSPERLWEFAELGVHLSGLLASQSGPRQQDVKLIDLGLPSANLVG
jgi:hypothetical protein